MLSSKVLICSWINDGECLDTGFIKDNYAKCKHRFPSCRLIIYTDNTLLQTSLKQLEDEDSSIHIYIECNNIHTGFRARDKYNHYHPYELLAYTCNRLAEIITSDVYNTYDDIVLISGNNCFEWPVDTIAEHLKHLETSDVVVANVINENGCLINPETYRDTTFLTGPEVDPYFMEETYPKLKQISVLNKQDSVPILSYFGGLLLAKKDIFKCSSGEQFDAFPSKHMDDLYKRNFEAVTQDINLCLKFMNGMYFHYSGYNHDNHDGQIFYFNTFQTNYPIIHPFINWFILLHSHSKQVKLYPKFVWKHYTDTVIRI